MHDTRTLPGRNKVTLGNIPAGLFRLRPGKKRLVFDARQKASAERVEKNQFLALAQHLLEHLQAGLRQNIDFSIRCSCLHILHFRPDTQRNV